jgi:predicted HTH transcriptional regulator
MQVELYNNRLEISNPGQLPYGLTLEMLKSKHNSRPANPLIAHPLYLYGSIEQMGTGTEKMIDSCVEQGLNAPEFKDGYDFNVTFWRKENNSDNTANDDNAARTGGMTGGMTGTQENIIKVLTDNPQFSYKKMSEILNINISALQKQMEKLKQMGIITRVGANFGGYWKVIQK